MSDITKKDIKDVLLVSLKNVLAKREQEIKDLQAKEAKGLEKLEKGRSIWDSAPHLDFGRGYPMTGKERDKVDGVPQKPKSKAVRLPDGSGFFTGTVKTPTKKNELANDNGVLPDLGKAFGDGSIAPNQGTNTPMAASEAPKAQIMPCEGCGSSNFEPLGSHLGMSHDICKTCGEVSVNPSTLSKVTPSDVSEQLMHKLKRQYPKNKQAAYATAWSIHKNKRSKRKHTDEVKKAELGSKGITPGGNSVEKARMSVGGPVASTPAQLPNPFNRGSALGKGEKTSFNDGAGTSGHPHTEIPGVDVGVDKANPKAQPPVAGKEIEAKGSGGDINKKTLAKGVLSEMERLAAKKLQKPIPTTATTTPGIIPSVREKVNAQKGITSLSTIRQRWHGAGRMDNNDIATQLKPVFDKLPHIKEAVQHIESMMPKNKVGGLPQTKIDPVTQGGRYQIPGARGQYKIAGTPGPGGGFAAIDKLAQSFKKAEGIPAAPKPPSAGGVSKPLAPRKTSNPLPNIPKL